MYPLRGFLLFQRGLNKWVDELPGDALDCLNYILRKIDRGPQLAIGYSRECVLVLLDPIERGHELARRVDALYIGG